MFENIQEPQKPSNNSFPQAPNPPQASRASVEDIFASTEKVGASRLAQMPPMPPAANLPTAAERVGLKKIIIFAVIILAVIIMIFLGFLLADRFLTPAPVVTQVEEEKQPEENIATTTEETVEEETATTTAELEEIVDTDGDGLSDDEELRLGTEADNVDTDLDGLTDYEEATLYETDPLDPDTDGDSYMDGEEVKNLKNPNGEGDLVTLPNGVTIKRDYNKPATSTLEAIKDTDGDGLLDKDEEEVGTDINKIDTDLDGLNDYDEVMVYGTGPLDPDTDSDGYTDGIEVKSGYNPNGAGKLE